MKNYRLLLSLLCIVFFVSGAYSQKPEYTGLIPVDPSVIKGKLDNGLSYYIKQNKKPEQRLVFRLAINAGSICETDGQQGLAHFCEHMCFNGTKNFPSNKMVDMLEEMGVKFGSELNAATGFDQTVYMLKIPTDSMEWINRGFQVIEDMAHQVSLEDADIEKERNVIVEEWRLGLGADDRMMAQYLPVLFKGSKYADRLPIGKVELIKTVPGDSLREFYHSWYRPDLMAVVIVGDIDPKLAEDKVKEYFGRIPKAVNPKPREEYPIPSNDEPLISIVTDKEASGYSASIYYKHPKSNSATYEDYRSQLVKSLYNGMLNSRLQEIAVKPDAPFLYAGTGYGSFIGRTIDVYSLFVAAKENQLEASMAAILKEDERVRRFGFTATELEREKKDVLASYERMAKEADKTESGSYADEYVRNFMVMEPIPGRQEEFAITAEFLPGISLEEVNKLGKSWVTDDNVIVLVTAPDKEGVRVPTEQEVAGIIKSANSQNIEAYVDDVSDSPLLEKVPAGTKVIKRTENSSFGFTELIFGNGARIFLKPTDFKNDEIILKAYSPGGNSLYPDSDIMSATLAASVISQSGLGQYNLTGLQKKLSGNTARLSPYISELGEGVSGNCSPKDLETMLQLNYLYFTETRRDEDAFNSYVSRIRNVIKPMRSNPQAIYQDSLSKILSLNSPRVIAIPTDAQVDQVNLDRAIAIYKERFADASDFTYFMVGNFNVDEVVRLLENYIGGLPAINRKDTWKDVSPGFPGGLLDVAIPVNSEPQSLVTMAWQGAFKWKKKDSQAFSMLMSILSIKCRESMREDQGGVYGVSVIGSTSRIPRQEYSITASWGCDPDNISLLSQTLLDEMEKIKKEGPSAADLNKVKENLIRARETGVKENSYWSAVIQNYFIYKDPILTLEEYKSFINSISANKIKKIANKYLDTKEYVKVSLTPAPEESNKE